MKLREIDLKSALIGVLATIVVLAVALLLVRLFDSCQRESSEEMEVYEQVSQALEAQISEESDTDDSVQEQDAHSSDIEIEQPQSSKGGEEDSADFSEFAVSLEKFERRDGKIKNGDYFSTVMSRLGVSQSDIYELDQKAKGVFDMRLLKVGYHYHAYYTKDESPRLAYMIYEQDNISYVVFSLLDSLDVKTYKKDIKTEIDYIELDISLSLWSDLVEKGAPGLLAIKLADIYAWSIDFFGLQKGDSFKAVYEKRVYQGEVLGVGNVLYAEFHHGDKEYKAYYFDDGSGNYYWNEKGESMRKAFLKAPLSYTRISSGFSYSRRHPVTRKVRAHTGIDYAAPAGTEVMSIGDGVVVYKGYKTQEGNMVKIKHNSVYTSAYLHLSKYAKNLKVGDRVSQGQVIGYVGSTGYSTGPHLDFRIWKNGTPINPLKMESPPANPIAEDLKDDFIKSQQESRRAASAFQARTVLMQTVKILKND